jgi:hypothetical protein
MLSAPLSLWEARAASPYDVVIGFQEVGTAMITQREAIAL